MNHVVAKTLVLLTMVLALTAVCWSTTGTASVPGAAVGLDDDPNQPDPNIPEAFPPGLVFSARGPIWLDDGPTDPNDPNVPEKV